MRLAMCSVSACAVLTAMTTWSASAQANDRMDSEISQDQADDDDESEARQERITVTGTRLTNPDLSARVETITAEDIAARGLATAEDVIRSIPQNFSTVNSASNLDRSLNNDLDLGNLGIGVATANLRGLGSANTLVLVNGRRLSGVVGQEDFPVNLRNIPASAIDRVEVNLDSGSAIYGSDAIGGVINIILKSGYSGAQVSARYEHSNNDGHLRRISGYAGKNWDRGSISASFSFTEQEPVSADKVGFTTRDYRSQFPDYADADRRTDFNYRSGAVNTLPFIFFPPTLILPPGNDGTDVTSEDFTSIETDRDLLDLIESDLTSETEDLSFSADFDLNLTDKLTLDGGLSFTQTESDLQRLVSFIPARISVPASNAFNPFGSDVFVYYNPITESENGLLPKYSQAAESEQLRWNIGATYALTDTISLVAEYNRSQSERDSRFDGFGIPAEDNVDADTWAALQALLASSDPNVAPNFFGDGSAQNESIGAFFYTLENTSGKSNIEEFTTYGSGEAWHAPGGPVSWVLGGQWRNESLDGDVQVTNFNSGFPDPDRDVWAAFGELLIPIVGTENARPGVQSLSLKLDGRLDRYEMTGPPSTADDDVDTVENEDVAFEHFSPRIGVAWAPTDSLLLRGSWSEAFRAPTFSEIFATNGQVVSNVSIDPIATPIFVSAPTIFGPNPDLEPETSESLNFGMEYTPSVLPGLAVTLDYAKIEFTNRITDSSELASVLPLEEYANLPEVFVRAEDGTLIEKYEFPINIAKTVSETLDANISYAFDHAWGNFETGLNVHYVIDQIDQATAQAAELSRVETSAGIDRYKARGQLAWQNGPWNGLLQVHYTPGYDNVGDLQSDQTYEVITELSSLTTVDASLAYAFESGLTLRGGVRDLLDAEYPDGIFGSRPYDSQRVDIRGRVAFVELNYEFSGF